MLGRLVMFEAAVSALRRVPRGIEYGLPGLCEKVLCLWVRWVSGGAPAAPRLRRGPSVCWFVGESQTSKSESQNSTTE